MEFNLKNSFNYLFFLALCSPLPSLAGAETAAAAVVTTATVAPADSATAGPLLPDAIWLIGLALVALVAITRRKLK